MIATCRAEADKEIASRAGADEVLLTGDKLAERIRALVPDGVDHIVEVAFGANIKTDTEVLAQAGSIATYATNKPLPETPIWQLVFVNALYRMLNNSWACAIWSKGTIPPMSSPCHPASSALLMS